MFDVDTSVIWTNIIIAQNHRLRLSGDSTWPNGTRSISLRIWRTLSEVSQTEIFPSNDHAFLVLSSAVTTKLPA